MAEPKRPGLPPEVVARATANSNHTYAKRRAIRWRNQFSEEKRRELAAILWPGTEPDDDDSGGGT